LTPKRRQPGTRHRRDAPRSTRTRRAPEKGRRELASLLKAERSARREAEKANRLKDEFLATLSHQLRNPLSAIVGWAHLLRDRRLDDESTARGLDTICRNAELQGHLISSVLEATESIAGPLHFDAAPVDLASLLASVLDSVKPLAETTQLRVEASLPPAAVAGDSTRLRQVFWSLISDAAGAAAPGGTLQVALEHAGSDVEVSIHRLEGRSASAGPREPTRQAEKSGDASASTWKLRFAVARYFVELHGGTIETPVPSGGPGATLVLRLPRARKRSGAPGG
jgi:signal transduction histidine kinase